jgi:N-acetylglucosaminyldiphosphoundecaprenol N-acetyl-beta-D-mannosaminyltransferase
MKASVVSASAVVSEKNQNIVSCQHGLQNTSDSINVLGVRVDALSMEGALSRVAGILRRGEKGYLSAINVYSVMEAQRDAELAAAYAEAAIAIPDGMPVAWVGRLHGHGDMERVAGPDLMREVFLRSEFATYTHFFYGGNEGVAEKLAENFRLLAPWARIVGTYTPPFRTLTSVEERTLIARINRCRPDMIWVGIGTPKQDKFMRRYLSAFDTHVMFGVGAAFDFHTGRIQDCSAWIKRAGMQWLHRLIQDPERLWSRYLRNNPAFLWRIALQLTGLRTYAPICTCLPAVRGRRVLPLSEESNSYHSAEERVRG